MRPYAWPVVDALAGEVRITMTHTGNMPTPNGPIAPTARTIVLESCDFCRFRDGRVVSFHTYFDQMAMLAQLGLLPSPDHATASA